MDKFKAIWNKIVTFLLNRKKRLYIILIVISSIVLLLDLSVRLLMPNTSMFTSVTAGSASFGDTSELIDETSSGDASGFTQDFSTDSTLPDGSGADFSGSLASGDASAMPDAGGTDSSSMGGQGNMQDFASGDASSMPDMSGTDGTTTFPGTDSSAADGTAQSPADAGTAGTDDAAAGTDADSSGTDDTSDAGTDDSSASDTAADSSASDTAADDSAADSADTDASSASSGFSLPLPMRILMGVRAAFWPILIIALLIDGLSIALLVLVSRKQRREAEAAERERIAEAFRSDGEVHLVRPQQKKKTKISPVTWILVIAAIIVLVSIVKFLSTATAEESSQTEATVYSATVESGDISTVLPGTGTLTEEDAQDVSLPSEVEITTWYVSNGDTVEEGDVLAKIDTDSALSAIASVQEVISSLDEALEELDDTDTTDSVTAAVSGRVKAIYAEEDESVIDTIYESGALLLLSLDGKMAVTFDTESEVAVGDTVTVTLSDGTEEDGTIESALSGVIVVTLTDEDTELGDSVTVTDADGNEIGTGELYIHSELKVLSFSGTVSSVSVDVEDEVDAGDTLLSLTDVDNTFETELLIEQRSVLEEQIATLFQLYQDGYLYAETSGVVSGISSTSTTSSDDDTEDTDDADESTDTSEESTEVTGSTGSTVTAQAGADTENSTSVSDEGSGSGTQAVTGSLLQTSGSATGSINAAYVTDSSAVVVTVSDTESDDNDTAAQEKTEDTASENTSTTDETTSTTGDDSTGAGSSAAEDTTSAESSSTTEDTTSEESSSAAEDTTSAESSSAAEDTTSAESSSTTEDTSSEESDTSAESSDTEETQPSYVNYTGIVTAVGTNTVTVTCYQLDLENLTVESVSYTANLDTTGIYISSDGTLSSGTIGDIAAGDTLILICSEDAVDEDSATLAPICVISIPAAAVSDLDGDASEETQTDDTEFSASEETDSSSESDTDAQGDTDTQEETEENTEDTASDEDAASDSGGSDTQADTSDAMSGADMEMTDEAAAGESDTAAESGTSEEESAAADTSDAMFGADSSSADTGSMTDGSDTTADAAGAADGSETGTDSADTMFGTDSSQTDAGSMTDGSDTSSDTTDYSALLSGTDTSAASTDAASSDTSALTAEETVTETLTEEVTTSYSVSETTLLSVTPQDYVYVTITIDELDILSVEVGLEAEVTLDAFPGQSFTGIVESIDTSGTNSGGNSKYTAVVRIERQEDMLSGMNASVNITLDTTQDVLYVPAEAIVEDETGTYIYTGYDEKSDTLTDPVEVETGVSDGSYVQILSGLSAGDTYYYSVLDTVNYSTSTVSGSSGSMNFSSMFSR